jgi:alkylhydroperoxidase/carboxymuconolactone decarboxylase family protein YurZ
VSRRPLPVVTRRWMTIALLALLIVAVVVAVSR